MEVVVRLPEGAEFIRSVSEASERTAGTATFRLSMLTELSYTLVFRATE